MQPLSVDLDPAPTAVLPNDVGFASGEIDFAVADGFCIDHVFDFQGFSAVLRFVFIQAPKICDRKPFYLF